MLYYSETYVTTVLTGHIGNQFFIVLLCVRSAFTTCCVYSLVRRCKTFVVYNQNQTQIRLILVRAPTSSKVIILGEVEKVRVVAIITNKTLLLTSFIDVDTPF